MMKKKLTALVAVLLVCLLLFPTAAFAYASDGETAPAETPAVQSADAVPPADTTETVGTTDQTDTDVFWDTRSFCASRSLRPEAWRNPL